MDQRSAAAIPITGQQALRLSQAHAQNRRRRLRRAPASYNLSQYLDTLQILFARDCSV
jgi:hypothetical protein